ncbi:thioesterase family protein [Salinisphaera sp. Q1T1-3]|uniref:acyl-CoA thioesterase n=1 Tax=Salinisphaera sp. Q1T1-3 TaxID=2321229 RepID=UPI000E7249CF|nr:thioesterase family protein [Salinisphaera sp. Q1T1-3]RJS93751.1 acyl-CoA thioesterase [Salinisphaera sp. Q1T1-3]
MAEDDRPARTDYRWFNELPTRWMDNDVYGHVNNVTYYSYFDTTANRYLIEHGGLDIQNGAIAGFVVASQCAYHAPIAFPDRLTIGLRVDHLGQRSVTYGLAVFREAEDTARATATFTHVFVDRATGRSVAMPNAMRAALEAIR